MRKIKVGVVGVGYLGRFHALKYAKLKGCELVGVVDIIKERADEVAKTCNTTPFYRHQELFDKVRAVSIAVPTISHYPITKDFLERGIDVLLEKPMAMNLKEARELVEIAEERHLIFQVGHLERFNTAVMALEGILKDPMFIESHRLSPFEGRGLDVDVVLDLMIHDIDIILSLVKAPVERIWAVGVPVLSNKVDIANVRIAFANGCVANITASRVSQVRTRKVRIFQADAYISIDFANQHVTVLRREGEGTFPRIVEEKVEITKGDSLEREIEAFVEAVRSRGQPPITGADGLRALEVAVKIKEEMEAFFRKHRHKLKV